MIKLTNILLKEYTEKTIKDTLTKWGIKPGSPDENVARFLIQRFDQIKSGLAQKLDIVVLPDELKKGNNYLNIEKYSFDDMDKLIRSIPENPEKIKKAAVERFAKDIDKPTAQSYVARFMNNKDTLKYAVENGTEDGAFSKEDVKKFIPNRLLIDNAFLDPRKWQWQPFEQMLDALFPSQRQAGEEGDNMATTDADKVYDKNGIEIHVGDDINKCISYSPVLSNTKRKKYGWCVTQVGNTNYDYYRFGSNSPTFYFVFDRNKSSDPEHSPFKDKWHAFVVQVNADGKSYIVTSANNDSDTSAKTWDDISKIVPSDTWNKIKDLKAYFKPIALSAVERGRKFAAGKDLSLSEFKELTQDEKILYIQGKASKNQISSDILDILPKYKINLEGRSTTLANVAIDSGQEIPYSALKEYESLAKRYAIFRFRHTNYSKKPIPLPYVQYLDEPAKEKYLNTFDNNLTFEYIEKYFGEEQAKKYVEKQIKNLDFLPEEAMKYINDDKIKSLYTIYNKLFQNWTYSSNTNVAEEQLEKQFIMPEQEINTAPLNYEQWKSLDSKERDIIFKLTSKANGNFAKYPTLSYAVPFFIEDNGNKYALLPKENKYPFDTWILSDMNGKIIKDNISGLSTLGDSELQYGYPDFESEDVKRIYPMSDLNITNGNIKESKRLKYLAGIIK